MLRCFYLAKALCRRHSSLNALLQEFETLLSYKENDTFSAMASFFQCMALINDLIRLHGEETSENVRVSTAQQTVTGIIRYLNEHIRETVSLRELSEHFYLTPTTSPGCSKNIPTPPWATTSPCRKWLWPGNCCRRATP